MEFANPNLLWCLALLPLLAVLRGAGGKTGSLIFSSVSIAKKAATKSRSSAGKILFFLRLLSLALLIIALARPRIGSGYSEREESGIDIALAIDVSGSMAALDFTTDRRNPITRLDAVKSVVAQFIEKRPNDRIGMIAFAANPFLVSPITLNHEWLLKNLERLDFGIIDGTQTAIGSAIGMSVNRLKDLKKSKSRVIILLTDGENNAGKISPIAAAEAAASFDAKIYTIAAGRPGVVPVAMTDRNQKLVRDNKGNPVYAGRVQNEMDTSDLKKIAEITGGKFFLADNMKALEEIYAEIDSLEKTEVKLRNFTSYTEEFHWFALAALAVLALELLLKNTLLRRLP